MVTKEQVMDAIREVYDPEIPINIVDLGFIYGVEIDGGKVEVSMTLTIPGCPMHQILTRQVNEAVSKLDGVEEVNVELTFEPRWTVDNISEQGKETLRGMGYNI
jgi:metal-sulfur cluster biosynthetic enzyme